MIKTLTFSGVLSPSPQCESGERNIFSTGFMCMEVSIISVASIKFIKYCREFWQISHSCLQSELSILFLNKVEES